MSTITTIIDLIKTELASGGLSNLKAAIAGTAEDQAAVASLLDSLKQSALDAEAGKISADDLKWAAAICAGGLMVMADAKRIQAEKAAISIALKILQYIPILGRIAPAVVKP